MDAVGRRVAESAAMLMIGEGVVALWKPQAHCRLWHGRRAGWSRFIRFFGERPGLVRVLAAAEIAAGLWLSAQADDPRGLP